MLAARELAPILVVEDADEDYAAFVWAMRKLGVARPAARCADGEEALAYLRRAGPFAAPGAAPTPALVVLDLNLGGIHGASVLDALSADETLRAIPVVVWTTSEDPADVARSYARGARGYVRKPAGTRDLLAALARVHAYWFETVLLPAAGRGRDDLAG